MSATSLDMSSGCNIQLLLSPLQNHVPQPRMSFTTNSIIQALKPVGPMYIDRVSSREDLCHTQVVSAVEKFHLNSPQLHPCTNLRHLLSQGKSCIILCLFMGQYCSSASRVVSRLQSFLPDNRDQYCISYTFQM
ncbi:hypothetical protein AcW2_004072 [Taiwanofungus camphoratus]|nr:hypothetical protein AcW2_004072 [Antrodia cinnamomea]